MYNYQVYYRGRPIRRQPAHSVWHAIDQVASLLSQLGKDFNRKFLTAKKI